MVPISMVLRRRGYQVFSIVAGRMPKLPGIEASGIMRSNGYGLGDQPVTTRLSNQWSIDWDNKIVACDGINHYATFLESMTKVARGGKPRLDDPKQKKAFDDLVRRSDHMLCAAERLVELADKTRKPVRIAAIDTHFAPWGVIRRWCDVVGAKHNIHLIALSASYENYFSNLKTKLATTVSIEDVTAKPDVRHPFLGGSKRFESYLSQHPVSEASVSAAITHIKVDRSQTQANPSAQRQYIISRIEQTRARGGKVFAVFGKVLIDFAAPDDRGHVFADFSEWLRFLVDEVNKTKSLLIVKPHPHELRSEIVRDGVALLRDVLPAELGPNVEFLEHTAFNSYELADLVDCAMIWNGTISAEFPVLGCPVVGESIWSARDYPIGNVHPRSRAEYAALLNGDALPSVGKNLRSKACAFLHFMRSADVAIPFGYVKRGATNEDLGANELYLDQLEKLREFGDPNVERAADRFFEFT
ncbi:hypothetical protein A3840_08630 [Devosia elaeis]|uniref:Capsule polysaccharide biosynthesis protein n=2 Tax=Devosia elaeis TaxID=1770058 RepID=A0A178I078_9HYPH|nr:hypothetical protein A3840_08630 [Devosia elaeis]